MTEVKFRDTYEWAFETGKVIVENSKYGKAKGADYLKRLIFDIRAEETPGRFLERLSKRLGEYKTNTNIQAPIRLLPEIFEPVNSWNGDAFYYLKSSILAGLLNALSIEQRSE